MTLAQLPCNDTTSAIIKAAIAVHRALGPGLLESVYLACLTHELRKTEWTLEVQPAIPVVYDGVRLDCGFRADLLVAKTVVVEVKSIAQFAPIHRAQLMTYVKLTGCPAGLLINFNVPVLKQGITRVVNATERREPP